MITPICPTCGCSLVRLGISKDKAATYSYSGEEYHFCCRGALIYSSLIRRDICTKSAI